jgi:hypothetical protein
MIRHLSSLFIVILVSACSPRPEPLPAPLPTMEAVQVVAPEFVAWLPVVALPEPVRGLAYCCGALRTGEAATLGISWHYDYTLRNPGRSLDNGSQYVPMLWCDIYPSLAYDAPTVNYFSELRKLPVGYNGYLLFANEPDLRGSVADGGQCERTPRQVAYMLRSVRQICPGCKVVGPNISHLDHLRGWSWLREFYAEAQRIGVQLPEVAAIHDYTGQHPALMVNSLFEMLADVDGAPKTAWVTEFGRCDPAWVALAVATYEADPRVARYAYFTARDWPSQPCMTLVDGDGLTAVGEVYGGSQAAYP